MRLENYEVHLPNHSIGNEICDTIGPVCESCGKRCWSSAGRQPADGPPYPPRTVRIGLFIFVAAVFGTGLVRRVAVVLSVCIIAGLAAVYVPNIVSHFSAVTKAVAIMNAAQLPFTDALNSAFLYGTFQLSNIAVFVQHSLSFDQPGHAVKSMGVDFAVNSLLMVMVVLGLMTVCTDPEAPGQSVPTLFMVVRTPPS